MVEAHDAVDGLGGGVDHAVAARGLLGGLALAHDADGGGGDDAAAAGDVEVFELVGVGHFLGVGRLHQGHQIVVEDGALLVGQGFEARIESLEVDVLLG
jgi:hypothetical protein